MKTTVLSALGLALILSATAFAGVVAPDAPEPGTSYMMATAVLGGLGFAAWKIRKK